MEKHVEEEHFEDMEALSLESNEENLVHLCSVCPLRFVNYVFVFS